MKELTAPVKISLDESQKSLREALSFSAKTEDPQISLAISQLIMGVDNILKYYERSKNPFEVMFRRDIEG